MTHDDVLYDRRIRLIEYAAECGNITHACRVFGVSRKTYYEWINTASQYGVSALLPRIAASRISPTMTAEEVSIILAEGWPVPPWRQEPVAAPASPRRAPLGVGGGREIVRLPAGEADDDEHQEHADLDDHHDGVDGGGLTRSPDEQPSGSTCTTADVEARGAERTGGVQPADARRRLGVLAIDGDDRGVP